MNPSHYAIIFALVSFALSSIFYLLLFTKERYQEILYRMAHGSFIFATFLMLHTAIDSVTKGVASISSGLSLIAAFCLISFLVQVTLKIRNLGTFSAPIATLLLLWQTLTTPSGGHEISEHPSVLITAHIYTSLIGEAFAILAFVIAILYLSQMRDMKKKQLKRLLGQTLSLSRLDSALMLSVWTGFILLTIGLILGAIYTQFYHSGDSIGYSKILWAMVVWVWYLGTLLSKNVFRLSAKKTAQMTFVGFALLAIGFFGLGI